MYYFSTRNKNNIYNYIITIGLKINYIICFLVFLYIIVIHYSDIYYTYRNNYIIFDLITNKHFVRINVLYNKSIIIIIVRYFYLKFKYKFLKYNIFIIL